MAIRAAFKAAEYGKQVAVLVPTTVLAEQHGRTFSARFRAYPFRIESLSRFRTGKETREILDDVAEGRVDIVIGTHRILSEDVQFKDLGLVVIDEEQRFGVEHKQRLLRFRSTSDVLTLSATPIPRTLHMAMLGLRDISSLTTAPLDRRSIVTEVTPYNEQRIKQAIARELARQGQVYFVHNRVGDIASVANRIRKLAPGARVDMPRADAQSRARAGRAIHATGDRHPRLDHDHRERHRHPHREHHVHQQRPELRSLDLHQLRGRVGRHKHRAYCYMLLPPDKTINEDGMGASRRSRTSRCSIRFGSVDLEIRGAGSCSAPAVGTHRHRRA